MENYNTDPLSSNADNSMDPPLYVTDDYLRGATPLTVQESDGGVRSATPAPRVASFAPGSTPAPAASPSYSTPAGLGAAATGTSAPSSPQIDGKAFFRAARGKLS